MPEHPKNVSENILPGFARLALDCVHREYPNQVALVMQADEDARPPRELTPIFFGCYDWHSAVHAHWTLARLCRTFPGGAFVTEARWALARSFTEEKAAAELAYLRAEGRGGFERPYGLAWLATLHRELTEWEDPAAAGWAEVLRALASEARGRLAAYFDVLPSPVRTGEHGQTAFSLGLALDSGLGLEEQTRRLYLADRAWPLRFEPSGTDFLSPGLAEADVMRRVLGPDEFATWLESFLPDLAGDTPPQPAVCPDPADGKLAHLIGLNLSRAWMLEGIASGLPAADPRTGPLRASAAAHGEAGLAGIGEDYSGAHWLGTFATYLLTRRGLA